MSKKENKAKQIIQGTSPSPFFLPSEPHGWSWSCLLSPPPTPSSPCSLPLSVIILWLLVIHQVLPQPWREWSVLWSCQAWAEVPAQSDCLHAGGSGWTGASTNRWYFVVSLDCLTEPPEETARDGKGLCFCLKERARSLKRVYQLCWPATTPSLRPAERAKEADLCFSAHAWGRQHLGFSGLGSPEKPGMKRNFLHAHTTGRADRGGNLEMPQGQADNQEQPLQGMV